MDAKAATRQYCQIGYTYLRKGLKFWDARAARGMSNTFTFLTKLLTNKSLLPWMPLGCIVYSVIHISGGVSYSRMPELPEGSKTF